MCKYGMIVEPYNSQHFVPRGRDSMQIFIVVKVHWTQSSMLYEYKRCFTDFNLAKAYVDRLGGKENGFNILQEVVD